MVPREEIIECIGGRDIETLNKLLQNHPDIADGKTEQGVSYLLIAAYYRNQPAVDLISSKKSLIGLHEAAAIGYLSVVKQFIGSDPALVDSFSVDGFTPLGFACFFNHLDVAKYLIEKGASVNIQSNNSFKVAPIHSSCAISSLELTELLIQNGADVNLKQTGDVSPLHSAAHNGQTRLAELLIEHGADVNAKTTKGETPLQMAIEKSFKDTGELIKQHGGN